MKNKKGFTLVELLATIILIGLLVGIGIPGVMKISESMKKRSLNEKKKLIEQAGTLYGQDNLSFLQMSECEVKENGSTNTYSCYKITIEELINSDYLESEDKNSIKFVNPVDNSDIKGNCVYIYKKNNRVNAYYSDSESETCVNTISDEDEVETQLTGEAILKKNILKSLTNSSTIFSEDIVSVNFVSYFDDSKAVDLRHSDGTRYSIASNNTSPNIAYAWLEVNESDSSKYDAYIGSTSQIYLPEDSSSFFSGFSNLKEINFGNIDTSRVTNMSNFFSYSGMETIDLSYLDTSNVTNMQSFFAGTTELKTVDLSPLDTSNVTNMLSFFDSTTELKTVDLSPLDTSNVTNMAYFFIGSGIERVYFGENFNSEKVGNITQMFSGCRNLKSLDMNGFDTDSVTNMGGMFMYSQNLIAIANMNFNTEKVTDMSSLFEGCKSLKNLDLSSFSVKNVGYFNYMFHNCDSLEELDLSNFVNEKNVDVYGMFDGCDKLKELHLDNFDFNNSHNHYYLFYNAPLETIYLKNGTPNSIISLLPSSINIIYK